MSDIEKILNNAIIPAIVSGVVSFLMLNIAAHKNKKIKFKEDLLKRCSEIHRIAFKNCPERHEEDFSFYLSDMKENINASDYIKKTSKESFLDKFKNLGYQYTNLTRDDIPASEKEAAKDEIKDTISSIKRNIEKV